MRRGLERATKKRFSSFARERSRTSAHRPFFVFSAVPPHLDHSYLTGVALERKQQGPLYAGRTESFQGLNSRFSILFSTSLGCHTEALKILSSSLPIVLLIVSLFYPRNAFTLLSLFQLWYLFPSARRGRDVQNQQRSVGNQNGFVRFTKAKMYLYMTEQVIVQRPLSKIPLTTSSLPPASPPSPPPFLLPSSSSPSPHPPAHHTPPKPRRRSATYSIACRHQLPPR